MSDHNTRSIFEEILLSLDIPESAYEKAEARYKDLGEWFDREESLCSPFSPHIYPQGSFRLGTIVRPVTGPLEYDLDLGCRLRFGITKFTHTQKQLINLVGADLEAYRKARLSFDPGGRRDQGVTQGSHDQDWLRQSPR